AARGSGIFVVFRGGHRGGLPNKKQVTKVALSKRTRNCLIVCMFAPPALYVENVTASPHKNEK
ncbi:MAG: hypothetical protein ACTH8C_16820, partial [Pseudomonas taetrolens]|uniref:hypothetical protein n=1 Tax=Pseudomonas taetrolens TaxID=47884 RepID=UPI003F974C4D